MKRASSVYDYRAADCAAMEEIRRERPLRIASAALGYPLLMAAAAALVILCAAV
jgi:hypothetical protein